MNACIDIAVVGAGPYGLAAAAEMGAAGREVRVFGEPLRFWETKTPIDMVLRSPYLGSDIGARPGLTLRDYERESRRALAVPIPVDRFIDYGKWFQERAVPDVDRRAVRTIEPNGAGFRITLEDQVYAAGRVVVAAGVGTFARRPPCFAALGPELVSHTMDHHDLAAFAGRRVAVIGGGQSALESAALLHELGADVEVLVRNRNVRWLSEGSWFHTTRPINRMLYARPDVGRAFVSHFVA